MHETPSPAPRLNLASLLRKPAEIVVAGPVPSSETVAGPETEPAAVAPTPVTVPRIRPEDIPADAPRPVTDPSPAPALDGLVWPGAAVAATTETETARAPAADSPLPRFLRAPARRATPWWQWASLALLAALLVLQVLLADRDRLAASPALRPLLAALCPPLGLDLPVWHAPEAISMLERNVQPLPGRDGMLVVEARFRNDARWEQALPVIELTLASADGQVAGQRRFTPADYHPQDAGARLAPGQSISVRWQVAEPAVAAGTFHFRFH